jgi:hypothetical protein
MPEQIKIPPKRRRKPWKPGDKVPDRIRAELDLPAIPPPPKREDKKLAPVARHASSLFTGPDHKSALLAFALSDLKAKGVFDVDPACIDISQTSLDRNFVPAEYEAIVWFADVCSTFQAGEPVSYAAGVEYGYVIERLPEAYLEFLEWVSHCQHPKRYRGKPSNKADRARSIFSGQDGKTLRANLDGYFKAICQAIAHLRAERETLLQRRTLEYARRGIPQKS